MFSCFIFDLRTAANLSVGDVIVTVQEQELASLAYPNLPGLG